MKHPISRLLTPLVVAIALLTGCAGVALVRVAPATNAPCPAGGYEAYLAEQADAAQRREEAGKLQQVQVDASL